MVADRVEALGDPTFKTRSHQNPHNASFELNGENRPDDSGDGFLALGVLNLKLSIDFAEGFHPPSQMGWWGVS
jgi:hypothetical protein